jgi:hypothetical protein
MHDALIKSPVSVLAQSIVNQPAQCRHSCFSILTLSGDFDDRVLGRSQKQHAKDALCVDRPLAGIGSRQLNLASEGGGELHEPRSASCV